MSPFDAPLCNFGWPAPDFALPDTDGVIVKRGDVMGENGVVVVFICNHCPYVKAIAERLVEDARALHAAGVGFCAISSNDAVAYPEDSPEKMKLYKEMWRLPFPYLYDADQSVARAFDAVCTPDFFGFDRNWGLQYRGRIDDSPKKAENVTRRELREAMLAVAETGRGPEVQVPSMGCSIKWAAQG